MIETITKSFTKGLLSGVGWRGDLNFSVLRNVKEGEEREWGWGGGGGRKENGKCTYQFYFCFALVPLTKLGLQPALK